MGTHISKVKSVDLDSWTDEQLQSVLKWGNGRANKYWEAKLAPGHVPSEAKIENFIRTKYESKRWVMDGPIPDPSTLEADDDDMVSDTCRHCVGQQANLCIALEEGTGESTNRAFSIAASGWKFQSASSTNTKASASYRLVRRRACPSTTEHRAASQRTSTAEGRSCPAETEQGRRLIIGLGLPGWKFVCATPSPLQHRACCGCSVQTRP